MASESGVVPEDGRSAVIVPLYKSKGERERTECKNYRGNSLLNVVGKIYVGILVNKFRRVTGGLIDNEQRGFRVGLRVDQIFTLKQWMRKQERRNVECMWVS